MSRKLRVLLYLSLALNLLIVGSVTGAMVFGPDRPDRPSGSIRMAPPDVAGLGRGLSQDQRRALAAALRANPSLRDGRARLAEQRQVIGNTLRADPFDPVALRQAFADQQAIQQELAGHGLDAVVEAVTGFSAQERMDLADRIERGRRRGGDKRD